MLKNVDIIQIVEMVLVFFALYGISQIGLALLNLITNSIDFVTVLIVTKGKKINPPESEQEYQSTNVIGFQVDSESSDDMPDEGKHE